ncbi:MAG: hypothetical protein JO186_03285 [Actinobacteria bacterium]|nr:hypothetical protein [Actinomycetota bacterium]
MRFAAAAFATVALAAGAPALASTSQRFLVPNEASAAWAGYALSAPAGGSVAFTATSGTWRQPSVTCGLSDDQAALAVWVGVGGYPSGAGALEQIGTAADCSPAGPPSYYAWYELYPNPPISFAMKVRPGDVITASVAVKGSGVILELQNRTRGTTASKRAYVTALDLASAEWVAEAPADCSDTCTALPLANFGSVTFSNVSATGNGHAGGVQDTAWSASPIQFVPDGSAAGTCAPVVAGGSFTLAWSALPTVGC